MTNFPISSKDTIEHGKKQFFLLLWFKVFCHFCLLKPLVWNVKKIIFSFCFFPSKNIDICYFLVITRQACNLFQEPVEQPFLVSNKTKAEEMNRGDPNTWLVCCTLFRSPLNVRVTLSNIVEIWPNFDVIWTHLPGFGGQVWGQKTI